MELDSFSQHTQDLLATSTVQSMAQWLHHGQVNCLQHSLFVAVTAHKLAVKLHLDTAAVARAGLLHDLYLYHKRDRTAHSGLQCVDHPKIAVKNAQKITDLSEKEENIILSHMWPFGGAFPRSPEAVLVNIVDTACAVAEFAHLYHPESLQEKVYSKG